MWRKGEYYISTDRSLLDHEAIHRFISTESYWGRGRSRELMRQAADSSTLCFGVYRDGGEEREQIGFARVLSDLATFGYVADVFILREHRGKGLGKWLVETMLGHPELAEVRRMALFTATPGFYSEFGFTVYEHTEQSVFLTRVTAPDGRPPGDIA